jgi:uncharacterized protein YbbK (DUF523 family)
MKIISACLLGVKCRYDGCSKPSEKVCELFLQNKKNYIPVCPEQLGGLPTPRIPAEIQNSTGEDVLLGKAKILDKNGKDMSENFIRGAEETLKIAKMFGVDEFIGRHNSPSCGCGKIHDGTFTDILKEGNGITVALLKQSGIKVISD